MGFEDIFDLDISPTGDDLEKLDKQMDKAIRKADQLKRKQDRLIGIKRPSGKGPVLPAGLPATGQAPISTTELSKADKAFEKKIKKIQAKTQKDFVKNFGKKEGNILSQLFGGGGASGTAKNLFNFGKNPVGFLTGALKAVPFLGGNFCSKRNSRFCN